MYNTEQILSVDLPFQCVGFRESLFLKAVN